MVGGIDTAQREELAAGFEAGTDAEEAGREHRFRGGGEGVGPAVTDSHAVQIGRPAGVTDVEIGKDELGLVDEADEVFAFGRVDRGFAADA